jgi:hypothetical protein
MTKKHFELVARVLKDANVNGADTATLTKLTAAFATEFVKDNPRFDAVRFFNAVGFVEHEVKRHGVRK